MTGGVIGHVLVVDDEAAIRETFEHHLAAEGHHVSTSASAPEALRVVRDEAPDGVLTDLRMEPMDVLEFLRRAREEDPDVVVIVMTAHEDMRSAVTAMKEGAFECLVKPLDLEVTERLVERAIEERRTRVRNRRSGERGRDGLPAERLVGTSPAMIEIYKRIGSLARSRAPVLIRGETGAGKERIARAIHAESTPDQPFLAVNSTALTDSLLESELFGHVKGAFTGATSSRRGIFEVAEKGTVFLDEIGDTSPDFQAKLLRVLQDGEFHPVGSETSKRTRARVVAATHRPLERMLEEDRFREDLYFRLRVVELRVPPLRERMEDVEPLTEYFLARIADRLDRPGLRLSADARNRLERYGWPGNVRELENSLLRAAVIAPGSTVGRGHLVLGEAVESGGDMEADETLDATVARHVQGILNRTGGHKTQTAEILGISRPRLDRLIDKFGLDVPDLH